MEANALIQPTFAERFTGLPFHTTREYELKLTKMAETLSETEYNEWTLYLENSMDSEQNPSILFSIFVVLSTYARRMKNISHFKEIVDRFGERFIEYPLYPHILSLLYKEIGTAEAIEQAVTFAKEASQKLPNQVGVLHNYAKAIIHARENGMMITEEELQDAGQIINRVTHLTPRYAKFYCTRGRILAAMGRFSEAKEAIRRAIDMEESEKKDYAIRINDYLFHLIQI